MRKHFLYPVLMVAALTFAGCAGQGGEPETLAEVEEEIQEKRGELTRIQKELEDLEILRLKLDTTLVEGKPVRVDTVKLTNFYAAYEVQGTAESKANIVLSSEVNGLVRQIPVREGQVVSKGQLLVNVDADLVMRNIEEVQTALELATTAFERQANLWEQNIGSEFQYLEAKNRKESLEKKLATLYAQYEKSNVRSPINGTVDEIVVKEGETVMPGMPLVRVVNLQEIEVNAAISESRLGTVKRGDEVLVSFPSINYKEKGTVTSVGQVINPSNRTFEMEVTVANEQGIIKPNLLARIEVPEYETDTVIVIARNLVQQDRDGQEFVFVIQQKESGPVAVKRAITTGQSYKDRVVVNQGLNPGELVVTEGGRIINDQSPVSIKNPKNNLL